MLRRFVTYFPVTMICLAFALLVGGAAFYYVQRTSDRLDANRQRSDRQNAKALILTDRKFRQALRAQAVLFSYSINKSTCVLRVIAAQQIARLETTKTTGYKDAEKFWQNIIDNQVPVPANFDCSTLPKHPPKASA